MKNRFKLKKKTIIETLASLLILLIVSANMVMIKSNSIDPMIIDFKPDKETADVNEPITFNFIADDASYSPISYFVINFHDDSLPVEILPDKKSVTHSFKFEGKYMVTLIAVSISGLTDLMTCEVEIKNENPTIEEVNIPDLVYEDQVVELSVTSVEDSIVDVNELEYIWDLGDGNQKQGKFITHSWSEEGIYPVTVVAIDDQGAIDQRTEYVEVKNVIPVAKFDIRRIIENCTYVVSIDDEGALVYENCPLIFDASSSYDTPSDNNRTLCYWDFGDGQLERCVQTIHIFTTSGTYNVTLKVKDDNGAIGTAKKTITVINELPEIEITTKNVILNEGETFVFEANSSDSFSDYMRLNYNWSFGKTGWRASQFFADDFNGNVSVSVTDPEGLTNTDTTNVLVKNVDPHVNVDWAFVDMNITMEIYGPSSKAANFSLEIIQNNETIGKFGASKPAGVSYYKTPEPIPFYMDLACNYTFIVNRTHTLECGTYWIRLTMSFRNGHSFTLWKGFNEYWSGWKLCPNEWAFDPENYIFRMPVTFEGYVYDPGADDIHIKADFKVEILLEINFTFSQFFCFPEFYWSYICGGKLIEMSAYKINGLIYVSINITENLIDKTYINEDGLPQEIYFDPTFYPVDLSFLQMLELINIYNLIHIKVLKALNVLKVHVSDDDGGTDFLDVKIDTYKGKVDILNLCPFAFLFTVDNTTEDNPIPMFIDVLDFDNDNYTVMWSFGDGSDPVSDPLNGSYIYHTYTNEGLYLITATVFDGTMTTKTMTIVEVFNKAPEVYIQPLLNVSQDVLIELGDKFEFTDSVSDVEDLRYYWEFGDGTFSPYLNVSHLWSKSGLKALTLHVVDDNGADGAFTRMLNVTNFAPTIEGPFGFQGVEGSGLMLEMAVFDNIGDELTLNFTWELNGQIINEQRPTVFLNDGNYMAFLKISDENGAISVANISLIIEDIPPVALVSSKIIYGKPGDISLKAYALDSFIDTNNLKFNWNINNETYLTTIDGISSELVYSYDKSCIITGQVEVIDDAGLSGYSLFQLTIIMDSDGDGLTDEFEVEQEYSLDSDDTDGDCITDWYELFVYNTSPINPDTDGDGLPDGYMFFNERFCGELLIGTNPRRSDTDADNLTDGVEFFGWYITVHYPDGTNNTYWTSSDPLIIDTDKDLLSDWEEYLNGTDPRVKDTDNDGRWDFLDIYPNRYDGDGDGLSDTKEAELGTDPTKPDTDNDGLSDGEEYYPGEDGFKTNPLVNDTDHDGLLDGQELYTISKKIDTRKKIGVGNNAFSVYLDAGIRMTAASLITSISVGELSDILANFTITLKVQGKLIFQRIYKEQRYFVNISDVKDLVYKRVGSYGGEWNLTINSDLECVLEEFTVEVTRYLNPTNPDFDRDGILDGDELDPYQNGGWITDPTKYDTDGDSISDKVEINNGWNPLSKDTDGDGVEDWRDIDPIANVIVEIKVVSGKYDVPIPYLPDPTLQATIMIYSDTTHKFEVATPTSDASSDTKSFTMPALEWRWVTHSAYYYSCKWIWKHGKLKWKCDRVYFYFQTLEPRWTTIVYDTVKTVATFGEKYYFDVNEVDKYLSINTELWTKVPFGWNPVSSGSYKYKIMNGITPNKESGVKVYNPILNALTGDNWVKLNIETIRTPRSNTIAIFKGDGDFIKNNHHYTKTEKMTAVVLNVDFSNKYFNQGFNIILIPTPIFADTKLHSIIETSVDENGQIRNNDWTILEGAEVKGINREPGQLTSSISSYVECVITMDIDINNATKILRNLILTGANESEGEIYQCVGTIYPETLGLAPDVLDLIPLDTALFINSECSKNWPRTPWENFIRVVQAVVQFIIDVLVAVWNFFVNLFNAIVEIGMTIAKAVVAAVLWFIELLFKAFVLAFIYLMFAITLLIVAAGFLVILGILTGICESQHLNKIVTINSITLFKDSVSLFIGYDIDSEFYDLLDLEVPIVVVSFTKGSTTFEFPFNFLKPSFSLPDFSSVSSDFFDNNLKSGQKSADSSLNQGNTFKTSDIDPEDVRTQLLMGMAAAMALCGSILGIMGAILIGLDTIAQVLPTILAVGLAIASFVVFIYGLILGSGFTVTVCLGVSLGLLVSSAFAFASMTHSGIAVAESLTFIILSTALAIYSLALGIYEVFFNPEMAPIIESIQFIIGHLILGGGLLAFDTNKNIFEVIIYGFYIFLIYSITSLVFFLLPLFLPLPII